MSVHAAHVAHHFDDAEQQRDAMQLGMWAFLVTELMFFGGLFTGYGVYRYAYYDAFAEASHHLDSTLGAINTGVLLTSSLCVALAVHAAQTSRRNLLTWYLLATMLLGAAFLGIKFYEYYDKYVTHHIPGDSFHFAVAPGSGIDTRHVELFYSFYFAMTGIHAVHMIIGIGVLACLLRPAMRGRYSAEYNTPVEMFGLYWHFVDIVWVFLYPLLYLIPK